MKKITKSLRRAIAQGFQNIVVPVAEMPSGVICNVGADHITYKLSESLGQQAKGDIGAQITRSHPQGKALTIFDSDGTVWYSLNVEESIY